MSSANEPLALRRATFRDALGRGDLRVAARAAARLQAHGDALGASELVAARAVRLALGRAVRDARERRSRLDATLPLDPVLPLRRPRRVPYAAVAVLAALAILLSGWLVGRPDPNLGEAGGGGGAPAAVPSDAVIPITAQSRGRVVLAVAAIPAAAEPVASAAPAPAESPAPAPGAEASAGPSGAAVGPGSGPGSGGGSGGGSGPGSGGGGTTTATPAPRTPTPSPAPTLTICSSSVPKGFARLCGVVLDARTGQPLTGACVSLGPCTAQSALSDPRGRWTFPLPVGNGTLVWNLEFAKAGYRTTFYAQTSRQGLIIIPTQRLVAGP